MNRIFVALTVALVCSSLVQGSFVRRALTRIADRNAEEKPALPEGAVGTRMYNALMGVQGSETFANTFYAFGNYINLANEESRQIYAGERKFDLTDFKDDEIANVEKALKEFKENFAKLDEVYENWLLPNVQQATTLSDLPKIFLDPYFQTPRRAYLKSIGKLALAGISPREIMPTGLPALMKVFGALRTDIKKLTIDKMTSFF